MNTGGRVRLALHPIRAICLTAAIIVAIFLVFLLSSGGYPLAVAGISFGRGSRTLTCAAMLLVSLVTAAVIFDKGQPARIGLLRHSGLLLFSIVFVLYLANGRTLWSGDTLPLRYMPLTVLREGNFDLDEFPFLYASGGSYNFELSSDHIFNTVTNKDLHLPYFLERSRNHYLSLYPVAGVVLIAPLYLPSVLGGLPPEHPFFETLEKISAAAIVAISAAILYFTLRRLTTDAMALAIASIYALGTSSLSVSSQGLYQHGPSQLALSAALYGVVRSRTQSSWLAFTGFWLAFAVICRPTDALIAAPLFVYLSFKHRRRASLLVFGAFPAVLFQFVYNYEYYGNLLHAQQGSRAAFWSAPFVQGLSGILLSPGRGLLIYSPIFVFSIWALMLSWRSGGDPILRSLSIGVVMTVLLYSKWFMWWGGYTYGPRLLADLTPVLCFSLYVMRDLIRASRPLKVLFLFTIIFSIYAHAVGAFIDDGTWNERMDIDRFPERVWAWTDNPLINTASRIVKRAGRSVAILP
jgi:hypothetical protein